MSATDKNARADELAVEQTIRLFDSPKTSKKFFKDPHEARILLTIQTLRHAAALEAQTTTR